MKPPNAAMITNNIAFLCILNDGNRQTKAKKGVAITCGNARRFLCRILLFLFRLGWDIRQIVDPAPDRWVGRSAAGNIITVTPVDAAGGQSLAVHCLDQYPSDLL